LRGFLVARLFWTRVLALRMFGFRSFCLRRIVFARLTVALTVFAIAARLAFAVRSVRLLDRLFGGCGRLRLNGGCGSGARVDGRH
jgi:hypothetical protein